MNLKSKSKLKIKNWEKMIEKIYPIRKNKISNDKRQYII